jgi:radical SAM superfamily enzyme YgiQ (UPF0313 family)
MATQPLGILYLTAVLRQQKCEVRAIDGLIQDDWGERVLREAAEWDPDIIGFSFLSLDIGRVIAKVRRLRQSGFRGLLLGGGVGPATADPTALRELGFDAVALSEAEETIVDVVRAVRNGRGLTDVPGLRVRRDGRHVDTAPRPLINDLDALPFPDQTVLPLPLYFGRPSMDQMYRHPRWASVLTSRSCPYRCTFCTAHLGKGYRPRSAPNVMQEIDKLVHDYGIGELQIVDDAFNLDRARVLAICDELQRRPYKLHLVFPNGLRLDRLDDEMIDALMRAGLDRLLAPIETASPRLQADIDKNLDLPLALAAIRRLRQRGALIRASAMIGFPGETRDEMRATLKAAWRAGAHWLAINRVLPLPGSPLGEQYLHRVGPVSWREFNYLQTSVNLSDVALPQIERLVRGAFWQSLHPWRLWQTWRRVPKTNFGFYARVFLDKCLPNRHRAASWIDAPLPDLPFASPAASQHVH